MKISENPSIYKSGNLQHRKLLCFRRFKEASQHVRLKLLSNIIYRFKNTGQMLRQFKCPYGNPSLQSLILGGVSLGDPAVFESS